MPRTSAGVLLSYAAVALVLAWPLPQRLGTSLTADPGGDGGIYVWNIWVFHHEVTAGSGSPYFTDRIFATDNGANLGLHNYTLFQNLLALPLLPVLGVVVTFNLIYLGMSVLTAWATFLLARRVTGGAVAESWLAGLFFAWSPLMVSRGTGHFSLVAAAPLAIFLLLLLRTAGRPRLRDGAALGATLWWAASTDVYYAVYCVMMAALFVASRAIRMERVAVRPAVRTTLTALLVLATALVAVLVITGGGEFTVSGRPVRMRSFYTPVLLLTLLAVVRIAAGWRPRLNGSGGTRLWECARVGAVAIVVATLLMAPMLHAAAPLLTGEGSPTPPVYWRSSPTGANLLAFVLPSPLHPLAPSALVRWTSGLPDGFIENVVAIPLVVLLVIGLAWRLGWSPPRWWMLFTLTFGLLALGPFVHVGTFNTHVPGPWALLRYVPVIALARAPQRFAVLMLLGLAMLFALALWWMGRTYPHRRRLVIGLATLVLAAELLPVPRALYSADVSAVHRAVAATTGDRPLLELPTGVRAGTTNVGNTTARSQYLQTNHGRPLVGGYLSRVPERQIDRLRHDPVLEVLFLMSEGADPTPDQVAQLTEHGPAFLARTGVELVVVDRGHAPPALVELAVRAFRLDPVMTDGPFDLYRVRP
jgi:hypothetical protein